MLLYFYSFIALVDFRHCSVSYELQERAMTECSYEKPTVSLALHHLEICFAMLLIVREPGFTRIPYSINKIKIARAILISPFAIRQSRSVSPVSEAAGMWR
jgi:hypothetical protein